MARAIMASSVFGSSVKEEIYPAPGVLKDNPEEIRRRAVSVMPAVGTCRMGVDERAVVYKDSSISQEYTFRQKSNGTVSSLGIHPLPRRRSRCLNTCDPDNPGRAGRDMTSTQFQTVVIGAGSIGTATAYWLAERGQTDVLVLEQFDLSHARGASNDHSRIIRHSYHNNTYGQLTQAAYDNWNRLHAESGQEVMFTTGGLDVALTGTPGVASVEGYRRVLDDNGHPYDVLDTAALVERFPQWQIDRDVTATYQRDSGIIDIRRACQTHVAMAAANGVTFKENTPVRRLESFDGGVRVHTDDAVYTAEKVVVATASWSDDLLQPLGATWNTTISQEQVAYFVPKALPDFAIGKFPLWVWHADVMFYGFPVYGEVAIKVSRDVTGNFVSQETRTMEPTPEETEFLASFVRSHLPTGIERELYSKTCVYDMPPDRDFIVDTLPGHPNIVVGLGAGHAAKFAGLLGEILSELVVKGETRYPIGAFKADRPALSDPSYQPQFKLKG